MAFEMMTSVAKDKKKGDKSQSPASVVLGDARVSKSTPRKRIKKLGTVDDLYEGDNNLVDSLRPGLILVFIGLNPGLETARTGTIPNKRSDQSLTSLRSCIRTQIKQILATST